MKLRLFYFLISFFLASSTFATEDLSALSLIGESDLRYFGFKVYHIKLLGEKEQFSYDQKFAINITYNMNFSKENLAKRSIQEIEKLHDLTDSQKKDYYQKLLKVFTSVKKGDQKIAFFLPQKGIKLYHNDNFVGEINDIELARLFVDIWLDERSSFPSVTKKLLNKIDAK